MCYAFLCTQVNRQYWGDDMAGYANGYVAIPKNHPLYGASYDDVDIDIHGGLTFEGETDDFKKCIKRDNIELLDGELPDGYWVFGFDTLHFMDTVATCSREWCIAEAGRLKKQLEEWGN